MILGKDFDFHFQPDYTWAPDELGMLCGGILAACMIVVPIALCVGLIRFIFTRATGAQWDNAIGDKILVCVIVGGVLLGSAASMVGWGMDLFGPDGLVMAAHVSSTGQDMTDAELLRQQISSGDLLAAAGTAWDLLLGR